MAFEAIYPGSNPGPAANTFFVWVTDTRQISAKIQYLRQETPRKRGVFCFDFCTNMWDYEGKIKKR